MTWEKSRILIIGGTGCIGKFIVKAGARAGHPTFALVRDSTATDPDKAKVLDEFKAIGVTLVHGDLNDHESLVRAVREVDVVISAVGRPQIIDQKKIIAAIKEAGNIKRFIPSEFGNDVDRSSGLEPAKSEFAIKIMIRRAIEEENIPYTYVVSNCFDGCFLPSLGQASFRSLPSDKVFILGNGNVKAIFNDENDIGTFTIKAVDDTRTLNKVLYLEPSENIYSHNELVSLWEEKTGKTFERVYISEEDFVKQIEEAPFPVKFPLAIHHAVFVKGFLTNIEKDPSFGVEATQLYPYVKYTTVEEYLNKLLDSSLQRFIPSEFGNDVDRSSALEPAKSILGMKILIRRAIEEDKIPYTYVISNCFDGYFLPSLGEVSVGGLPTEKVFILGNGNVKGIFNDENDIGTFTIKAVDDPRTLNKVLYLEPSGNIYSHNELISLWEEKTGKTLERVYISEEDFIKQIEEAPFPTKFLLAIHHALFVKGSLTKIEIDPSFGVEATQLYPDVNYTTVDEYLNKLL